MEGFLRYRFGGAYGIFLTCYISGTIFQANFVPMFEMNI